MTRLFLHFWNLAATFRIWSSDKKNPYLKYVSSHFLFCQLNYIRSASDQVPLVHLNCTAHYRPHLAVLIISLHIRKYAILLHLA